ncbi:MAG TPA: hypothetical protein VK892_17065 [Pyrinomonadaceae bacterium]|nr:hypothetical protein [Pyrinomonadaceae bacterium]
MSFLKTNPGDNLSEKVGNLSLAELLANKKHPATMVRAFVLTEIASRAGGNESLWRTVEQELQDEENRQTKLRGFLTVSMFVLGEIAQMKQAAAESFFAEVLSSWTEKEQADFADYFRQPIEQKLKQIELQTA